jgi:hypothetical protein
MSPAGAQLPGRLYSTTRRAGSGNELDPAERRRAFDDVFAADGIQIISAGTGSRLRDLSTGRLQALEAGGGRRLAGLQVLVLEAWGPAIHRAGRSARTQLQVDRLDRGSANAHGRLPAEGRGIRLVSALPGDYIQTDALNHGNSGGQLPTPTSG